MASRLTKEEKVNQKKQKYDNKISSLNDAYKQKLDEEAKVFNATHEDTIDQDVYYAERNVHYQNKIAKKQKSYDKKLAKYSKKLDKKEKELARRDKRIWEIDFIRGFIIWGMVWDHLTYDFTRSGLFYSIFKFSNNALGSWMGQITGYNYVTHQYVGTGMVTWASNYWNSDFRITFRLLGVITLVVLCGISSHLSKNNFKRGGLIFAFGMVVTLALNIVGYVLKANQTSGYYTYFILISTLTCLGLCILIYNGVRLLYLTIEKVIQKSKHKERKSYWKYWTLGISLIILISWAIVRFNYPGVTITDLKSFYYAFNDHLPNLYHYSDWADFNPGDFFKYFLGLEGFGADWLGLFPFLGYIFLGGFIGETVYKNKKSFIYYFYPKEVRENPDYMSTEPGKINAAINKWTSPISFPGQHTLLVYIFHQPIIIAIFGIIFLIGGATLTIGF